MKKIIFIVLSIAVSACAQNRSISGHSLPGDISLPSSPEKIDSLISCEKGHYKYSVEDFFEKPKASSFQLSPDGTYLSYKEKGDDGKTDVYVKKTQTHEVKKVIREKDQLIRRYGWVNNERLLYVTDKGGDENYHIFAVDIDGTNEIDLTPFPDVKAGLINILKEQKDHIIISMNKNNPEVFEPYKVNVITGEMEQLFENNDLSRPAQGYLFDKDGNLRGFNRLVNGLQTDLYYKNSKTGAFELIKSTNWDDTFHVIDFNYRSADPDDAYVVSNLKRDKAGIFLYDLKANKPIKQIFSNENYDVSGMAASRKRNYEIDYFSYVGEKYHVVPVSDFYKAIHGKMAEEFGDKEFFIVDHTDEEDKYLIVVTSDRLIGEYYQYDVKKNKIEKLFQLMPQLIEKDMAQMKPISFTSRDGLTIHGYLTLPKEAVNGKRVPLIVNPHGGPQGVRDSWGFNPEVQLFASRGYATLQVNFRISGGYGKTFLKAGYKQIGRKVMDDLEDGVRYVIKKGWVDKDRIAIYGASHGGYAVLMGLVKTPDLYACGVDYVGVSNIETFMKTCPPYWKPFLPMMKKIWYDLDDPEEYEIAKTASPVHQIDKIKKPLFVVQGGNDPRVNIHESDQIVSSLRKRGFYVPYMVKYNEGHGFYREENRIELYRSMMGFFAKHLK